MTKTPATEVTDPREIGSLLSRTALDIVLAGDDADCFQAAHGNTRSVLVLRMDGDLTVWKLCGGGKDDRKAAAASVRQMFKEKGWTA